MGREEIDERIGEMITFSELGHFIDSPIKTYSSGMLVRLGFSVAAHMPADVLLIDEVLAVGDEAFQRKFLRRIADRIEQGATVVLVSHAPATIEQACRRVIVLNAGHVVYDGPTPDGLRFYHQLLGLESGRGAEDRATGRPGILQEARLQDGEGRPRQVFASGERLRVTLVLEALDSDAEVEAVVEIRQVSGQPVFRTAQIVRCGTERSQATFEIPRLALLGGDYDVALAAREPGEPDPPIFDRVLPFSVAHAEGAEGIADLRGAWALSGDALEVGPVASGPGGVA
jgi:energy-coupling factor transporter ATP-binding protein EcfA2